MVVHSYVKFHEITRGSHDGWHWDVVFVGFQATFRKDSDKNMTRLVEPPIETPHHRTHPVHHVMWGWFQSLDIGMIKPYPPKDEDDTPDGQRCQGRSSSAPYHTFWQICWHSIWHAIWQILHGKICVHIFWHYACSVWHRFWHLTGHFSWNRFWHSAVQIL